MRGSEILKTNERLKKMKKTFLFAAVLSAGALFSADLFNPVAPTDFAQKKSIQKTEEGLSFKGNGCFYSYKSIAVDSSKKYRISGEFRFTGTPYKVFYLGYIPLSARHWVIAPVMIDGSAQTETTLAENAAKGAKVLKVTDASKWNVKRNDPAIAFNAKAELADMPNRDFDGVKKGSIKKAGDVWEVELTSPLKKAYAAGTRVRQHFYGGTYIYNVTKYNPAVGQWIKFSGVISGETKGVRSDKQFWTGTKSVFPMILVSGGKADSMTEFRNFKMEEVK